MLPERHLRRFTFPHARLVPSRGVRFQWGKTARHVNTDLESIDTASPEKLPKLPAAVID
jgi:hypothetical protein